MKKLVFALASATALIAAPAIAADLGRMPVKAPVAYAPVAMTNWSGFYIGGHVGGMWSDLRRRSDGDHFLPANVAVTSESSGIIGGGHVGFNWQMNNIVLGVEGTGSWTSIDRSYNSPFASPVGSSPVVFNDRIQDIYTVVGKLGFAWDRSLIYAKGGYANVGIRTSADDTGGGGAILHDASAHKRHGGWTVGGGWDYLIAPNWIIGVDYNYIRAQGETHSQALVGGPAPAAPVDYFQRVSADLHAVTLRASYKFGFGGPVMASY